MTTDELLGSRVVAALEAADRAIRANHPELGPVFINVGTGLDGYGLRWGHFRKEGWDQRPPIEVAHLMGLRLKRRILGRTRVPELFVSGERLAEGATLTFQTLLHERCHALAAIRGIRDMGTGQRHLKEFVEVAAELGMEYLPEKAHPNIGYSQVTLTEAALAKYADVIAGLEAEIVAYLDTLKRLGIKLATGGGTEGKVSIVKAPRQGKDRNAQPCICDCEEFNRIMVPRATWAAGRRPICSECGSEYRPKDLGKMEDNG